MTTRDVFTHDIRHAENPHTVIAKQWFKTTGLGYRGSEVLLYYVCLFFECPFDTSCPISPLHCFVGSGTVCDLARFLSKYTEH